MHLCKKLLTNTVCSAIVFFSLNACVSSNSSQSAGEAQGVENDLESQLICKREKVTGSNRKQKVCRTKAQIERERQAAKEIIRKAAVGSGVNQARPQ